MKNKKKYDVFNAFLVKDACYDGYVEMPHLNSNSEIPERLTVFSKAYSHRNEKDLDCGAYIVFYEDDYKFERIWKNTSMYLPFLKRFKGVVSPDFSLYRNMPLPMQIWNTYRNRALGYYFQYNGINLIPNVRFGDERTFDFCFNGIPSNSVVSIGTQGCIKSCEDKECFRKGLKKMVDYLNPHTIIVYGATPDDLFLEYKNKGIKILQFDSATTKYYKYKEVLI